MATFIALRHPVTILVTVFTLPDIMTSDFLILKFSPLKIPRKRLSDNKQFLRYAQGTLHIGHVLIIRQKGRNQMPTQWFYWPIAIKPLALLRDLGLKVFFLWCLPGVCRCAIF